MDVGLATSMFVVFRNFGGTLGATFVGVMIVGSTGPVLPNAEGVIQGFVAASVGTAVASALALAGALSLKDKVIAKAERPSRQHT